MQMSNLPELSADRDLHQFELEEGVWAVVGRVKDYTAKLFAQEAAHVSRAVESRRFEFSTGRHFARLALERCGGPPGVLLRGEKRHPIWPDGFVGSISHTRDLAFVLALKMGTPFSGVGVDIEKDMRLSDGLERLVLTKPELERVRGNLPEAATWVFSAKEAVFKAINPIVGVMIDFDEVEIDLDMSEHSFTARYVGKNQRNELIDLGRGSLTRYCGHILSRFAIMAGLDGAKYHTQTKME